jgi:phospholipid/cholesterol/gamma-HCH transport system substrate-binding protein
MNKNFTVGLFVIAGLALFSLGIFLVGDRHQAFAHHVDYYAEFVDLAGLSKGAKVRVGGMDAGQVLDIGIPDSPLSRFRVKLRIDEKLRGLVRTDSVATIGTEGIVGDTFLLVRPGGQHALPAAPLATLSSKEPVELSDLLDRGTGLLNDADTAVKDVDGTLKTVGGKASGALDGVAATVANVNDVVVGLKQGRGAAGMLLRDPALAVNIREAVTNAQQATVGLNHASGQADALISDLQSRHLPQKADETMTIVKSAASNIDESTRQLHQTLKDITKPDEQGNDAATNIRESLSNVNSATANMADDTEALKRNFFFKGFFRRRGYYDLTDISPDKYRKDQLFTSAANGRAWLTGGELFQNGSNGSEQLSPRGKVLLNDAVAQFGDSITESPIMIEGYRESQNPADQLAMGRSRAILVRQYLQNHFQIDARNLGVVSMRETPPDGVDHPAWDGICIVVVRHRS